ncbi:MAG: hypothetical protein BWX69_03041 [Planctomycetes bacterium ADurb.Bin069]|nr:MAG: hypothetical protein BWX69_03041 [Planctomycetes bacterium ADurb.Bin069]
MRRALPILLPLAALLSAATPAAADPLSGALLAVGGLLASAGSAIASSSILTNLLVSVSLTALGRALMPKPETAGGGVKTRVTLAGGDLPQTIIFGRRATGGALIAPPYSHGIAGDGNEVEHLVIPYNLADYPVDAIESVIIDGKACVFDQPSDDRDGGIYGLGTTVFPDRAWLRTHDGRQSGPDGLMRAVYGDHPLRPWGPDAILTGIAYAILTYKYDPDMFSGLPQARFVVRGARLYDPRRDSTAAGGSGSHRWGNRNTWEWTENPIVMAYTLFRGLTLDDGTVYGVGVPAVRLPLPSWAAAMNKCDEAVAIPGGGTRPRYRAGLEFAVTDEPLDVIERIGLSCGAEFAEEGGVWTVDVGAPASVAAWLTDDDLIVEAEDSDDPFAPLNEVYNGAGATWPNPARLWEASEARPYTDAGFEAADGGRRLVADLELEAVSDRRQVKALLREYVKDARRQRKAVVTLPPAFLGLQPLQVVSWTSTKRGFLNKRFEIRSKRIDPLTLCVTLGLRERDPSDYDPDTIDDDRAPSDPSVTADDRVRVGVRGLAVSTPLVGRRAGIRVVWNDEVAGQAVRVQARPTGTSGVDDVIYDRRVPVELGRVVFTAGVLPSTGYDVRAKVIGRRRSDWSDWLPVTTADGRMVAADIAVAAVAPRHLVTSDYGNIIPDNQIQDPESWYVGAGSWTMIPAAGAGSSSIGAWRAAAGAGECYLTGSRFPVDPDSDYVVRYQLRRIGGTTMRAHLQLRWFDSADTFISSQNVAAYDGASGGTERRVGRVTSPATAALARARLVVDQTGTDGAVRFTGPYMQRQAETDDIRDGAVTRDYYESQILTVSGSGASGSWITYHAIPVTIPAGGARVEVNAVVDTRNSLGGNRSWDLSVQYGPANDWVPGARATNDIYQPTIPLAGFIASLAEGTYTFRLRHRMSPDMELIRDTFFIKLRLNK